MALNEFGKVGWQFTTVTLHCKLQQVREPVQLVDVCTRFCACENWSKHVPIHDHLMDPPLRIRCILPLLADSDPQRQLHARTPSRKTAHARRGYGSQKLHAAPSAVA